MYLAEKGVKMCADHVHGGDYHMMRCCESINRWQREVMSDVSVTRHSLALTIACCMVSNRDSNLPFLT